MAAFAAKYGPRYGGVPPFTLLLEIQRTRPRPRRRRWGRAARLTRWVPSTLVSKISSTSSALKASAGPSTMWPAFWMTTSRQPLSATIWAMAASTDACEPTSSSMGRRSTPCSLAYSVAAAAAF